MNPIKIVIADDHKIYRDGLKLMLENDKSIKVLGEAANGIELVEVVRQTNPDVVLTDIVMPEMDGIAAVKEILKVRPALGIIALSMFDQEYLIIDILEAGAISYLLKNAEQEEVCEAIRLAFTNYPYFSPSISSKLVHLISGSSYNPYTGINKTVFNEVERQVIKLICEECTTKEIAAELYLSPRTVEGYRKRIMEKMKVKSSSGIIIYAIKKGLYKI